MQDFRVVYDPELDSKKKHNKLSKSYYRQEDVSLHDPRTIETYSKLGKGKTKIVREYYPVLFEFDEFSKTGPVPNSILLTTSPKVDQNELLMVIQEIGKLESFSFAKNHQGLLLASVTFGHSSAVREAALKWNGTKVNDHRVLIELDDDCQKFHERKIKPEETKRRHVESPSLRGRRNEPVEVKHKIKEVVRDERKRDYSEKRHSEIYESRHYRPEKEHYSRSGHYKADSRREHYRIEEKGAGIMVKERRSSKSTLRMIQEEIVSIVERDYHNRVILQMITDFIGKSLPIPSFIADNQDSISSFASISFETREKVKRPLPTFKKLKSSEPVEKTSSKLIKKNYKLLSKKKRFYMESDADSSSSSSLSGSSNSDSDDEGENLPIQPDLMEIDANEIETTDIQKSKLAEQVDLKDHHVLKDSKIPKKPRTKKSAKKKANRQIKDAIIYQKPTRIPFNFTELEERVAPEIWAKAALVPDGDYQSDVLLDISDLKLEEMGYDSEDQRIITFLLMKEAEKRTEARSNRMHLFDEDGQRRHLTGSARSEGYYAITSAEKKAHARVVSQRNRDTTTSPSKILATTSIPSEMRTASSRASRFTQRQLILGPDSKKQPVPIDSAESVRFKQMKNRKTRLKFAKSDIHDWGLFAMEKIEANDMIIEYIGEKIRLKIADLREIQYEKQGIGSSYLFRVDDDIVIDATKIGNLARFINHCCEASAIPFNN